MPNLITYDIAESAVATMAEEYLQLCVVIDDEASIKSVKTATAQVVRLRNNIEKRRKELKAPYLDIGKQIDAEAKRLTELILPIEKHLKGELEKLNPPAEPAPPKTTPKPKDLSDIVHDLARSMHTVAELLSDDGKTFMATSLHLYARQVEDFAESL
jgi:transposase